MSATRYQLAHAVVEAVPWPGGGERRIYIRRGRTIDTGVASETTLDALAELADRSETIPAEDTVGIRQVDSAGRSGTPAARGAD